MFVSWAEKKLQLLNPDVADHALWNFVLCERSDLQKQGRWPVTAKSDLPHFWHVKDRDADVHIKTHISQMVQEYWVSALVFRLCYSLGPCDVIRVICWVVCFGSVL